MSGTSALQEAAYDDQQDRLDEQDGTVAPQPADTSGISDNDILNALARPSTPPATPIGGALGQARQDPTYDPSQYQLDPNSDVIAAAPPAAPAGQHSSVADFGRELMIGLHQTATEALGAASAAARAVGSDPSTVAWVEKQKAAIETHANAIEANLSPEGRAALHTSLFGQRDADAGDGQASIAGRIGATVATALPQVAGGVAVGTAAAAALPAAVLAVVPAGLAATAATGLAFGTLGAGDAYNHLTKGIDDASTQQLMQQPVYAHLRSQGVSDQDARRQMVASIAPSMLALRGGVDAVAGAGLGGALTGKLAAAAGSSLLARAGVGAAEAGGTMGAQSGADDALDQSTNIQIGAQRQFDPTETAKAVAGGTLSGAVFGAVAHSAHAGAAAGDDAATPRGTLDTSSIAGEAPDLSDADHAPDEPTPMPSPQDTLHENLAKTAAGGDPVGDVQRELHEAASTPYSGPDVVPDEPAPAPYAGAGEQGSVPTDTDAASTQAAPQAPIAALSKAKVIDELVNTHGVEQRGLASLKVGELRDRLATARDQATNPASEPTDGLAAVPVSTEPTDGLAAVPVSTGRDLHAVTEPTDVPGDTAATQEPDPAGPDQAADPEQPVPADAGDTQPSAPAEPALVAPPAVADSEPAAVPATPDNDEAAPPAAPVADAGPTPAQAEAGNYAKEKRSIQGLPISIETAKGDVRRGPVDDTGKPAWEVTMPADYGYVRGTVGADGDHVDTMLGPHADELAAEPPATAATRPVYVVDQVDPKTRKFDEHKTLIGFADKAQAVQAYDDSFSDGSGPTRRGAVTEMPLDGFKDWLKTGDTTKPVGFTPSAADAARQARALRKQQMAAPVTPIERATPVHVADDASEPAADPLSAAASEASMRATFDKAARSTIQPLAKGADVSPVMRRMLAELEAHVGDTVSDDPAALHASIKGWGQSKATVIPGTRTRRGDISSMMLRLMKAEPGGRDADAAFREEAGRVAAAPVARDEGADAGRTAASVDGDYGSGGGERPDEAPEEREHEDGPDDAAQDYEANDLGRSDTTTDRERIASDLLNGVLQGTKTPREAADAFDWKPGSRGRPPRPGLRTFAGHLQDRIAYAEDPDNATRLLAQLSAKPTGATPMERRAQTRALNRLLDETGSDRAALLREHLAELTDPVGAAVMRQEQATVTAQPVLAKPRVKASKSGLGKLEQRFHDRLVAASPNAAKIHDIRQGHEAASKASLDALRKRYGVYDLSDEQEAAKAEALAVAYRSAGISADEVTAHDAAYEQMPAGVRHDVATEVARANEAAAPVTALPHAVVPIPASSAAVRSLHAADAGRTVQGILDQRERTRTAPLGLHAALDLVSNDSKLHPEARNLVSLLRNTVDDLPITTPDDARSRGLAVPDNVPGKAGAAIFVGDRPSHVVLAPEAPHPTETLLHEAAHIATHGYFRNLQADHPDARTMRSIGREMTRQYSRVPSSDLSYALGNVDELHTMLLTNPSVQDAARNMRPSETFLREMQAIRGDGQARSPWRRFTDIVRRMLGMPAASNGAGHTLLDHVIAPTHDILDRASRFSREVRDPVVHALGAPLDSATGGEFGERNPLRRALDRVDPQGVGDKARKGLLTGANTDSIIRWNRDLFEPSAGARDRLDVSSNPLLDHRIAQEGIADVAHRFHEEHSDITNRLTERLAGNRTLASLTNDATLAEARLGTDDPRANAHLKTDEQKATLASLQARYAALSDHDKATYGALRDLNAKWYRLRRAARLDAVTRSALPDATPAEQDALRATLATAKSTREFLAKPDESDLATRFANQWDSRRALVKAIAKLHQADQVQGDYFRLGRYGDYVVRYGARENGDYGVEMFERRGDAEARRAELARQGAQDLSQVQTKSETYLKDIRPNSPIAEELEAAIGKNPKLAVHADSIRDVMQQILLDRATRTERSRMALRRQGVRGASEDVARNLAQDFMATGTQLGNLAHGQDRAQALNRMDMLAADLGRHGQAGQQIQARAVINELQKRLATGDDAHSVLAGVARKASSLGYVQSLMSFSGILIHAVETHMNSTSLLGARHGPRAALALGKALADVTPELAVRGAKMTWKSAKGVATGFDGLRANDWNLSHVARDRLVAHGADAGNMRDLFRQADQAGLINHTMDREMQRIAGGFGQGAIGSRWQRFLDMNAAGAHAAEVANKAAVLKAAYDLELGKAGDHAKAARYAVETLRQVVPNYNLANKARITTAAGPLGDVAGPLTQFKNYGIHMYGLMANLTRESMKGATPEARREAGRALAGVLATHAMAAGSLTLLGDPLRLFGGAYDFFFNDGHIHDYQNDLRGWLSDHFGPTAGELLARGLPHALGIDIHKRVGLDNLLELPDMGGFDAKSIGKAMATAMVPASAEDAAQMAGGVLKAVHGDLLGGLHDMVPRVVRDVMKAQTLATKGVTDGRGQTILPADKLPASAPYAQALGFQPAAVSEFHEGRAAALEQRQETTDARTQLTGRWLAAAGPERQNVMAEIGQWNAAHPEARITVDQLLRTQAQHARAVSAGAFGLQAPRRAAASLVQAGRFANVQ